MFSIILGGTKIDNFCNHCGAKQDIKEAIIEFFLDNPKPSDKQIHKLAEDLKMEPDKFEQEIYLLLGELIQEEYKKEKKKE